MIKFFQVHHVAQNFFVQKIFWRHLSPLDIEVQIPIGIYVIFSFCLLTLCQTRFEHTESEIGKIWKDRLNHPTTSPNPYPTWDLIFWPFFLHAVSTWDRKKMKSALLYLDGKCKISDHEISRKIVKI